MGNITMAIEAAKPFVHAYIDLSGIIRRIGCDNIVQEERVQTHTCGDLCWVW